VFLFVRRPPLVFHPLVISSPGSPQYSAIEALRAGVFTIASRRAGNLAISADPAARCGSFGIANESWTAARADALISAGPPIRNYNLPVLVPAYLPLANRGAGGRSDLHTAAMSAIRRYQFAGDCHRDQISSAPHANTSSDAHLLGASGWTRSSGHLRPWFSHHRHGSFGAANRGRQTSGSLFYVGMLVVIVLGFFVKRCKTPRDRRPSSGSCHRV